MALLSEEDRRVLEHTRRHLREWLPVVDRLPPAELIERILPATAYAYELRGPRLLQAWENLKKMRSLVRRIQNRGYATLARIADYIDSLSAGDESNAVVDTLDAVNLMTVHASKGLEFPIVFVVNLAKGASGPPKPMRIIAAPDREPAVSIGPFVSEVDEIERDREKQETRRLLYVALTRARDRLYLSSALKDGAFAPGPGSLGEVLPDSLRALFVRAATAFDELPTIGWTGQSGQSYELLRCQPPSTDGPGGRQPPPAPAARPYAMARAAATGRVRTRVTEPADSQDEPRVIAGRLVHRLFQFAHLMTGASAQADETVARELLRPDERAVLADVDQVVGTAVASWRALREKGDVERMLREGTGQYEVPFSFFDGPTASILRGTIDCLVLRPDGSVLVVELKTGGRQPEHDRQLAAYVAAAGALFPGARVEGILLYP
jgi:ATP-dependent helicase/nuclease subunit A